MVRDIKLENRVVIKAAKQKFVNTMRRKYADFTEKKWANTTYRTNHPQGATS